MPKKLKNIKLFEEYTESKNHIIKKYFDELTKKISEWFDTGSLSTQNLMLVEVDSNNMTMGTTKTLKLDFKDENYTYTVIVLLAHEMFEDDGLKTCYLTTKRYSSDGEMLNNDEEIDLDINDLTEDYIISKIASFSEENIPQDSSIEQE